MENSDTAKDLQVARQKDEQKRKAILAAAKSLFALHGYHATGISHIRRESGYSTGTIYTYFSSKEEMAVSIVEEGWNEIMKDIHSALASPASLEELADFFAFTVMPRLMEDEDLIHILLSETPELSSINDKLIQITNLVLDLSKKLPGSQPYLGSRSPGNTSFSPDGERALRTAVSVYFLGTMEATRISRRTEIGVQREDILSFIRDIIIRDLMPPDSPVK